MLKLRDNISVIFQRLYRKSLYPLSRTLERYVTVKTVPSLQKLHPRLHPFKVFGIPSGITLSPKTQNIYPSRTIARVTPPSIYTLPLSNFKTSYLEPEQLVAALPQGIAHQKGALLTHEGKILRDFTVQYGIDDIANHRLFRLRPKNFFPKVHYVDNNVAWLTMDKQGNIAHWFYDILTRLALFEKAGLPIDSVYAKLDHPFQRESLHLLGYSDDQIIDANKHPFISAKNLLISTTPCSPGFPTEWMCAFFMEKFASSIEAFLQKNPIHAPRIYISRKKTPRRQIDNEADLESLLKKYGFTTIYTEDMSLLESCAYFYQASAIFAPHGAALTRLIFCQPQTKVIELLPLGRYTNLFYWHLSVAKQLSYYYITSGSRRTQSSLAKGHASSLLLSLEDLEKTLKLARITQ